MPGRLLVQCALLLVVALAAPVSGATDQGRANSSMEEDEHSIPGQLTTALRFYRSLRRKTGLYLDKTYPVGSQVEQRPPMCALGSTGFGLVFLAIEAAHGVTSPAAARADALKTVNAALGIQKAPNGFLLRYPADDGQHDPAVCGDTVEYSTVDTAILVLGALFASNYFKDDALTGAANKLALSVNWGDAIADSTPPGKLFMTMEPDGAGSTKGGGPTTLFNEYYLLALCGAAVETRVAQEPAVGPVATFFNALLDSPPHGQTSNYCGIACLTDRPGSFASDFQTQFGYFLSAHFQASQPYVQYLANARDADVLYWSKLVPDQPKANTVWGLGAGAYPSKSDPMADPSGYCAIAILTPDEKRAKVCFHDNDVKQVYSAPIVAGFLPIATDDASRRITDDLLVRWHTYSDLCAYTVELPAAGGDGETLVTTGRILWRAALGFPKWRAPDISGVDFATLPLGMAARVLGNKFFLDNAVAPARPSKLSAEADIEVVV